MQNQVEKLVFHVDIGGRQLLKKLSKSRRREKLNVRITQTNSRQTSHSGDNVLEQSETQPKAIPRRELLKR